MKWFFETDFIQIMSGVDLTQKQRRKTAFFIFVRAFIQQTYIFLPYILKGRFPIILLTIRRFISLFLLILY